MQNKTRVGKIRTREENPYEEEEDTDLRARMKNNSNEAGIVSIGLVHRERVPETESWRLFVP